MDRAANMAGPLHHCLQALHGLGEVDTPAAAVDAVLKPIVSPEDALEAIGRLHPAARDIDMLPSIDTRRPSSTAVQSAIWNLGKGSANGFSS